jgi:hypothetical protein
LFFLLCCAAAKKATTALPSSFVFFAPLRCEEGDGSNVVTFFLFFLLHYVAALVQRNEKGDSSCRCLLLRAVELRCNATPPFSTSCGAALL